MKACIRNPNPCVMLEGETVYNLAFEYDEKEYERIFMNKDFVLPFGRAKILREGKDITLVSYGKPLDTTMRAVPELLKLGISPEVINLRSLRPLDRKTIVDSVKKTHHIVTIEDGFP